MSNTKFTLQLTVTDRNDTPYPLLQIEAFDKKTDAVLARGEADRQGEVSLSFTIEQAQGKEVSLPEVFVITSEGEQQLYRMQEAILN